MEELFKYTISPIIAGFLAYYFAVRGKKKDVDIQKEKELNVVLSHMLNTWYYLTRLDYLLKTLEEKENPMIIPREFLPVIIFKSGQLNDTCFTELEKSIETLRQYDPVTYFELEGIGKRLDFLRSNYVVPFLKGNNTMNVSGQILSRNFLDKLLNDVKKYTRTTAKLISRETLTRVEQKFDKVKEVELAELKHELNSEVYNFCMSLLPVSQEKPSIEEFIEQMKSEQVQTIVSNQLKLIMSNDLNDMLRKLAQNPETSIEEL